MKTVLIFTYYWPPASGPGVQRWLKFVKYLPENGWNPVIVTPESGSYPNTDVTLLSDVPEDIKVIKTRTMEPFRWYNMLTGQGKKGKTSSVGMSEVKDAKSPIKRISAYIRANWFIPDARVGWVPYAITAAEKFMRDNKVDLIITTGPPHSSHIIGQRLKKKHSLPWIADMRDPWTNIYYNAYLPRTEKTKKKDQQLEDEVLGTVDEVIVVSQGLKEEFEGRAKGVDVLYNGFDEEDFKNRSQSEKPDQFKLSYIGNFKANQNILTFWNAVKALSNENEEFASKLRVSLIGNIHPEVMETVKALGLTDLVDPHDFVDHAKAISLMKEAGALLFIIPQAANANQILTGKLFEYLAAKTPMLSIGPIDGNAAVILKECERAEMLDYEDIDGIKKRLQQLFESWEKDESGKESTSDLHLRFSRKNLTNQLASIMENLTHDEEN